jgi:anti-sigma factor RsiW
MTDTTGPTTQAHEWYQDLLGAYALGALLPDEAAALEAHLATCPTCPEELRRLRFGAQALALTAEERDPSPDLRNRIWAATFAPVDIAPESQPVSERPMPVQPGEPIAIDQARAARGGFRTPAWMKIAAVLAVLLIGSLLAWNIALRNDESGDQGTVVGQLAPAPDAPDQATGGEVRYLADDQVMLIELHDLPALAEGEVYQLWLIRGDAVSPAGTFQPNPTDPTTVAVTANPDQYDTLAITREPGPIGSPGPTTKPFLLGNI